MSGQKLGDWIDMVLWLAAKVYHQQMTPEDATEKALNALTGPQENR